MKRLRPERPLYSKTFLRQYGETLVSPEIRLVNGFRQLPLDWQERTLSLVTAILYQHDRIRMQERAAKRAATRKTRKVGVR